MIPGKGVKTSQLQAVMVMLKIVMVTVVLKMMFMEMLVVLQLLMRWW